MPRDSRPCHECGGGDDEDLILLDEDLILLCEGCDVPAHAHCVGFTGSLGNGWFCRDCIEDQAAASEGHESEDEGEEEDASVAAGACSTRAKARAVWAQG